MRFLSIHQLQENRPNFTAQNTTILYEPDTRKISKDEENFERNNRETSSSEVTVESVRRVKVDPLSEAPAVGAVLRKSIVCANDYAYFQEECRQYPHPISCKPPPRA
uniref:DNA ligase n=1 Tax=Lygus hesperus TaxID=30085 RepID=A0A0A9WKH3_LYGHE